MQPGTSQGNAAYYVDCTAGYYCTQESTTATPSGAGGDRCPPGYFCEQGTDAPVPCPPGTYNPSYSSVDYTACLPCPEGFYCEGYGSSTYTVCANNYYCETDISFDWEYYIPQGTASDMQSVTGDLRGEFSPMPADKPCPKGYSC